MTAEVQTRRLDFLCSLIVDCPHSTPEWTDSGVIVLRSPNIRNGRLDFSSKSYTTEGGYLARIKRAVPSPGDLVITREAPMGEVCMIPDGLKCCLGQRMVLLRPDEKKVHGKYLLYALQSPGVQHQIFWAEGTGSTVSNLRIPSLKALEIPVPSLQEQKRIAETLGSLDDKIELNRRMNQTLEAIARALFKSWFVDFDPVRAKAEGRDTGLPEYIADLFPGRFVDSELGEIPEGWSVVKLPEIIEVNPKRTLKKGDVAPYLDMANMPTQGHSPDSVIPREYKSGMRFTNGDALLARITPCLENGKAAFVDFLEDGQIGWGSTEYIVLRAKTPLPHQYAYCIARNESFRGFAIQSMVGTSGRQRVPAESLSHFYTVKPSTDVAKVFGEIAEPLFARAKATNVESRNLIALRNALLPELISGNPAISFEMERNVEVVNE